MPDIMASDESIPCPNCENGHVLIGTDYVSHEMAMDAGDPALEGEGEPQYDQCGACEGTGLLQRCDRCGGLHAVSGPDYYWCPHCKAILCNRQIHRHKLGHNVHEIFVGGKPKWCGPVSELGWDIREWMKAQKAYEASGVKMDELVDHDGHIRKFIKAPDAVTSDE